MEKIISYLYLLAIVENSLLFHLVKEDDPLDDLVDVLENAPREHHLPHLDELQAEALRLQLVVRLLRLLVRQRQLRVLRPLEEVKVTRVVLRIVYHV